PVLVNGRPVSSAQLVHGDVIKLGAVQIAVRIEGTPSQRASTVPASGVLSPVAISLPEAPPQSLAPAAPARSDRLEHSAELERWEHRLDQRQCELERESQALAEDRVIWYERRQEIEREIQESREALQKEIARSTASRSANHDGGAVEARP